MACQIPRILTFKLPVPCCSQVEIIDSVGTDQTSNSLYSWSMDGSCWTSWASHEQYVSITSNLESDFWLRVLIYTGISRVSLNNTPTTDYSLCIKPQDFTDYPCSNPNLFRPYDNLDCALRLQQNLADMIGCIFGIPAIYFRVLPDEATADYTFKEYVLHGVADCKNIKVIIQDGEMPSSNPKTQTFDFDWDEDWNVEISKTAWALAFGDEAFPKQRDFLYIPLMNRLWEVNAAYDEKKDDLMWRSTTWKLALVKYTGATNVDKGSFEDIIDHFTNQAQQDSLMWLENEEVRKEPGTTQIASPKNAATNLVNIFLEDSIRKALTKDLIDIKDRVICHGNNIIARNLYIPHPESQGLPCITYQKGICGESGALSFIIDVPDGLKVHDDLLCFGPIHIRLQDNVIGLFSDEEPTSLVSPLDPGLYMVILTWNKALHAREMHIYRHTNTRPEAPQWAARPEFYRFDIENPVYESVIPYNPDWCLAKEEACSVYPIAPITNIKLWDAPMPIEQALKESLKYTSNTARIADLARPLNTDQGFAVR